MRDSERALRGAAASQLWPSSSNWRIACHRAGVTLTLGMSLPFRQSAPTVNGNGTHPSETSF